MPFVRYQLPGKDGLEFDLVNCSFLYSNNPKKVMDAEMNLEKTMRDLWSPGRFHVVPVPFYLPNTRLSCRLSTPFSCCCC